MEGGREGGRKRRKEGGREGGREGRKEGGREEEGREGRKMPIFQNVCSIVHSYPPAVHQQCVGCVSSHIS
jgi:hypothetical protein